MPGRDFQYPRFEAELANLVQQQAIVRLGGKFLLYEFDCGRVITGKAQLLDMFEAWVGGVPELDKTSQQQRERDFHLTSPCPDFTAEQSEIDQ